MGRQGQAGLSRFVLEYAAYKDSKEMIRLLVALRASIDLDQTWVKRMYDLLSKAKPGSGDFEAVTR